MNSICKNIYGSPHLTRIRQTQLLTCFCIGILQHVLPIRATTCDWVWCHGVFVMGCGASDGMLCDGLMCDGMWCVCCSAV